MEARLLVSNAEIETILYSPVTVSIRYAEIKEIPAIAVLLQEAYRQTYRANGLYYYTDEVLQETFGDAYCETMLSEMKSIEFQYFSCVENETLAGFAKLAFKADHAYLDKLYLLNNFQGKGYGHQLIQACFNAAAQHGYTTMKLNVWPKNEKAVKFYERHGFTRGKIEPFLLFGGAPMEDANMEMLCEDITPFCVVAKPFR